MAVRSAEKNSLWDQKTRIEAVVQPPYLLECLQQQETIPKGTQTIRNVLPYIVGEREFMQFQDQFSQTMPSSTHVMSMFPDSVNSGATCSRVCTVLITLLCSLCRHSHIQQRKEGPLVYVCVLFGFEVRKKTLSQKPSQQNLCNLNASQPHAHMWLL